MSVQTTYVHMIAIYTTKLVNHPEAQIYIHAVLSKPKSKFYPHADSALWQTGKAEPIIMRQNNKAVKSQRKRSDADSVPCIRVNHPWTTNRILWNLIVANPIRRKWMLFSFHLLLSFLFPFFNFSYLFFFSAQSDKVEYCFH